MSSIPLSFLTASQDEKDAALVGAASYGNVAVATHLLDAGANPNASCVLGGDPRITQFALTVAASCGESQILDGKAKVLDLLLRRGGDVITQEEKDQALFKAIHASNVAVHLLLQHGANPNAKRADGRTPLHVAVVAHGDPDILTPLIDAGADVDERDDRMAAPLRLAIEFGRTDAVKLLLDRGADPDVTHSPDHHVSTLAVPCKEIWRILVLDPRTGDFRQRFEEVVAQGEPGVLNDLLAQREEGDDISGGIPLVLHNAYLHTSGQRTVGRGRAVSPSNRWAEARRCVRSLLQAGAPDEMMEDPRDRLHTYGVSIWFERVRPEILRGTSQFERTAATITKMVVRKAQRSLRKAIEEAQEAVSDNLVVKRVRL
ncbi:ankyrin repeat domain-containing protein [Burkholderia anthina]|uniref:ankyrin repeat domain-containing protein n=1 Tax=Burkholderia anthina TaxID=179879 RepID=UPI0037BE43BD